MDIKVILKSHLQQKQVNMSYQLFQCLQYHHLKTYKIDMMYIEVKTALKSFVNP